MKIYIKILTGVPSLCHISHVMLNINNINYIVEGYFVIHRSQNVHSMIVCSPIPKVTLNQDRMIFVDFSNSKSISLKFSKGQFLVKSKQRQKFRKIILNISKSDTI